MADVIIGDGDLPADEIPELETDWCLALQLDFPDQWAALTGNGLNSHTNQDCYIWYNAVATLDLPGPIGPPVVEPPVMTQQTIGLAVAGILLTILFK